MTFNLELHNFNQALVKIQEGSFFFDNSTLFINNSDCNFTYFDLTNGALSINNFSIFDRQINILIKSFQSNIEILNSIFENNVLYDSLIIFIGGDNSSFFSAKNLTLKGNDFRVDGLKFHGSSKNILFNYSIFANNTNLTILFTNIRNTIICFDESLYLINNSVLSTL